MQRMNKEGVEGVHLVHNTSEDMKNKHYDKETDDLSIIERFDRIYAKRIKRIK
jgi:hypothetical protein